MINAPANFTLANAAWAKLPVYIIEIEGYARVFTNRDTGVPGQYPWIVLGSMQDLTLSISDMDGGADLSDLIFNVQDVNGAITADFPSFVFEGKRVTLKTGVVGMVQADFITLFTGLASTVESDNNNLEYIFDCVDIRQELTKVIYTVGDDGQPTDSDHPRTLNGHPLDILIAALENELGIAATDIDLDKIQTYRDGIYSGLQFAFKITSPPAAKDFIENELMKPLGAYIWPDNLGRISVNFFYPQVKPVAMTLTKDHFLTDSIPLTEQADLVNTASIRFDYDDSDQPLAESIQNDGPSQAKYGLYGQHVIESRGMRSAFQGFFFAALAARLVFIRYAGKTLQLGGNNEVDAIWTACILEPGDQVSINHPDIPDRVAGVMGITGHIFEVMDRTYHFPTATVALKLLDLTTGILNSFKQYLIAPNCQPDYLDTPTTDSATLMFLASDSDTYSNGDPAATLS